MPIIDLPVQLLLDRLARSGVQKSLDDLVLLLPTLGCEIEEVATMRQYGCGGCDRFLDRTEAQGRPGSCPSCGTDFSAHPELLSEMDTSQVLRLNMLAVRPDLFDPGGMARFLAGYLGLRPGLPAYSVAPPRLHVRVDPRLALSTSLRPHIACAVVRGVTLNHDLVKMIMNLQEDLHWALGRDRKLASIGFYDLDQVVASETAHLSYDAVDPDSLRFVPLGFPSAQESSLLTPREILAKHKTGVAYAHLLKGFDRVPLLRDAKGTVLSMPPIINSEPTRVTLETRSFFIDVTGLSRRTVDRALAIIVTSLLETIPGISLEQVWIDQEGGSFATPDLSPSSMRLDVREAAETIGVDLDPHSLRELLERMGHAVLGRGSMKTPLPEQDLDNADGFLPGPPDMQDQAEDEDPGVLDVLVAPWRNDVMHPVDLIEDVAVAYGYDRLIISLVPTFTVGAPRPIEELASTARRVLTGLGLHQVMTLVLSNEESAFERWSLPVDPRAVRIENPISTEQTLCRVSLLPGLLETLSINKQHDLPQELFEVGDVSLLDPDAETGASEERLVGVALIGTHVGYADIRAIFDAFAHEMGRSATLSPLTHPSFIPGRVAALRDPSGPLGLMGELHPSVLEAYGLHHPVSVMELNLTRWKTSGS